MRLKVYIHLQMMYCAIQKVIMFRNKYCQKIWDFIGIPFRLVLFDQSWLPMFGWTTLEDERINRVLTHIQGRLLDIGAGNNKLVKTYKNGTGVDIYNWDESTLIVKNTASLPFRSQSFDTITFLACLNHIPNRVDVISESARLLKPNGKIIITMINPILGGIGHTVWWYGEDRHRGGMQKGEVGGLWKNDIISILKINDLQLIQHERFVYGLNNLYIFKRFGQCIYQ